ncbi:hypothetical protein [uncultured Pseudodesulfovibrio sp.]|uniref:hypothetical protein n=1 Tax=uncultured Pseudodesulfovibrio sp. TaxID=2035858 RepID=UPI0029C6CC95|nr:hypothetical protein [uncultured Pseudodesulfovibrio sp.]
MSADQFSSSISIDGEVFDFDPERSLALMPCDNCGHLNEVEVTRTGEAYTPTSFSCENCGHWNSFD